jgi:RNA polymerase sigma-70 factor (ECF subfamily)
LQEIEIEFNEAVIVERAIDGDGDAFGELYLHYLDAIYRYVYFRIGNPEDAEDLTEQVFLKAWEALSGYQDFGHPFSSWLYKIAHNMVIDHHRLKKPLESIQRPHLLDWPSRQSAVLKRVIEAEDYASLAQAISQLPDEQQQLIILRFIEGLEHAEIGQIMNKRAGACRMMQSRALAALNRLLKSRQG